VRVADGWAPSVGPGGALPAVPRRRRVIPQPFQRQSVELSPPTGQRRVWRYIDVDEVQVGDTVPGVGVVLSRRGRPVIGCSYVRPRGEAHLYKTLNAELLCWLADGHGGDHCYVRSEAEVAGTLCVPGWWWTLCGPEVEIEYPPHVTLQAYQLEGTSSWS
jgi:hypothetical protein